MIMKIRSFVVIASLIASLISPNALAVNLIDVYKQALSSDPTFKAARAQWLADRETLAIKRAALFPQLGATAGVSRNYTSQEIAGTYFSAYGNQSNYSLQLTQTLFDFGKWANVWQAQATAKRAEVTFLAAAESLLLRTSKAYFEVLRAKDMLSYARANKEYLGRTLNQTKHKYDVGLIAIVDLENDRAAYDGAIAKEIAADNDLSVALEKLSEITGIRYISLDPLKENYPLLSPQPADIEKWAKAAEQQNFDLAAAHYATIEARENIKILNAGHLPTLNAQGSYSYNYYSNPEQQSNGTERQKNATAGLSLNLPLFQGGQVLAQVKQANYQYQKAISSQETTHRSTTSSTRQAYLTVLSNISQIKANKQAITSAESSLRATKAGYEAGTQTMVDVLQVQANLYDKQKDYATSEYAYITQLLTLKQLTGILDVTDLAQINTWLEKQKPEKPQTTNNGAASKSQDKQVKKQAPVTAKKKIDKPKAAVAQVPNKKPQPVVTNNAAKPTAPTPAINTVPDTTNTTAPTPVDNTSSANKQPDITTPPSVTTNTTTVTTNTTPTNNAANTTQLK
jgi:outer membrane protein